MAGDALVPCCFTRVCNAVNCSLIIRSSCGLADWKKRKKKCYKVSTSNCVAGFHCLWLHIWSLKSFFPSCCPMISFLGHNPAAVWLMSSFPLAFINFGSLVWPGSAMWCVEPQHVKVMDDSTENGLDLQSWPISLLWKKGSSLYWWMNHKRILNNGFVYPSVY